MSKQPIEAATIVKDTISFTKNCFQFMSARKKNLPSCVKLCFTD